MAQSLFVANTSDLGAYDLVVAINNFKDLLIFVSGHQTFQE